MSTWFEKEKLAWKEKSNVGAVWNDAVFFWDSVASWDSFKNWKERDEKNWYVKEKYI